MISAFSGARPFAGPQYLEALNICNQDVSRSTFNCARTASYNSSADDVITNGSMGCLVGQPVSVLVDKMTLDNNDGDGMEDDDTPAAHTEFCVAWPPTFPVGGSVVVVELRAAVSLDAATTAQVAAGSNVYGGDPAVVRAAALRSAAAEVCGRVVAVREDVVVAEEGVRVDAAGRASARLRMSSAHTCVTSCILASDKGIPSLESLQDAAPLMALPQAARDEAHRLLWRMMHEALPPNHSTLPFDPDVFRSPLELLPPRLQAALSWAWSRHFRAFAHDFAFLLDCMPPEAAMNPLQVGGLAATATTPTNGFMPYGSSTAAADAEELAHYQSVLSQVVCFLRDNNMYGCLATLLQSAVDRGLQLQVDGAVHTIIPESHLASSSAVGAGDDSTGGLTLTSALATLNAAAAAAGREGDDVLSEWLVSLYGSPVPETELVMDDGVTDTVQLAAASAEVVPMEAASVEVDDVSGTLVMASQYDMRPAITIPDVIRTVIWVLALPLLAAVLAAVVQYGAIPTAADFAVRPAVHFLTSVCTPVLIAAVLLTSRLIILRAGSTPNSLVSQEGTFGGRVYVICSYVLDAVQTSTAVWYTAAAAVPMVAAGTIEALASVVAAVTLWRLPAGVGALCSRRPVEGGANRM